MTALELLESALRLIGVLGSGESLDASGSTDALAVLNMMIDSWSTQQLMIPNQTRETFPLVAGQQTYTMGPTGNFNTSRPMSIIKAIIQLASQSPVVELPMKILTVEQYAGIVLKTLASTFPLNLYSDNANPLTSISVWPVPTDSTNNLVLYSWKPLTNITALTTSIVLPPGYLRALRYNVAVELAPEYGKTVSDVVSGKAVASQADIKRMNHRPRFLQVDAALVSRSGTYNWRTDGYDK